MHALITTSQELLCFCLVCNASLCDKFVFSTFEGLLFVFAFPQRPVGRPLPVPILSLRCAPFAVQEIRASAAVFAQTHSVSFLPSCSRNLPA